MSVSETDLELIEASLDGDTAAADAVAGRVAVEPALAEAMADAASAREARRALWQAITPTQTQADQFAWRVRGAIAGQNRTATPAPWWKPGAVVRYGSVAAACIVFGFSAGRMGNSAPASRTPTASTPASSVLLPISDEYGNVVGWQPFKTTEEAKQFQTGLHALRPVTPVPVSLQSPATEARF